MDSNDKSRVVISLRDGGRIGHFLPDEMIKSVSQSVEIVTFVVLMLLLFGAMQNGFLITEITHKHIYTRSHYLLPTFKYFNVSRNYHFCSLRNLIG